MIGWEYWVHRYVGDARKIEQVLNELGAEGWELVTVDEESIFYLKRSLADDAVEPRTSERSVDPALSGLDPEPSLRHQVRL